MKNPQKLNSLTTDSNSGMTSSDVKFNNDNNFTNRAEIKFNFHSDYKFNNAD